MGLFFNRRKKRAAQRVVRVSFCDPHRPLPDLRAERPTGGYAYAWNLPFEPMIGHIVYVTGAGAGKPTIVIGFGPGDWRGPLESVTRLATEREVEQFRAAEEAFFAATRRAVGLNPGSRRKVRDGWPEVAPATGDAPPDRAHEYGRAWWRAFRLAEQYGRPADEVRRYSQVAHRWFAIRDRGER